LCFTPDSRSALQQRLLQAVLSGNLSDCKLAVDEGADINACLSALLQSIKSSTPVLYQGNDLDQRSYPSPFLRHQLRVINYLLSLDVIEEVLERGIASLRFHDIRRKAIVKSICCMLEKQRNCLGTGLSPFRVQFGLLSEKSKREVFMAFVETNSRVSEKCFAGIGVIFRNPFRSSLEGIRTATSQEKKENPLSSQDQENIRQTIAREGRKLWSLHSNLNIISACSLQSSNNGNTLVPKPCIVLYCSCKGFIPDDEPDFPKILPSRRGNITIDVREGYFQFCHGMSPNAKHDKLRMGGSVGSLGKSGSGTVGPFVQLSDTEVGFISCAHVFVDIKELLAKQKDQKSYENMKIVQPSYDDVVDDDDDPMEGISDTECGSLVKLVFDESLPIGIDAALVRINYRKPERGTFSFIGRDQLQEAGNLHFIICHFITTKYYYIPAIFFLFFLLNALMNLVNRISCLLKLRSQTITIRGVFKMFCK